MKSLVLSVNDKHPRFFKKKIDSVVIDFLVKKKWGEATKKALPFFIFILL